MLIHPIFFIFLVPLTSSKRTPPKYTIDLDLQPSQRWNRVIKDHLEFLPGVVEESKKYIPKPLQPFVWWVASKVDHFFPPETRQELEGIARESGLPLGEIVGLNILYDIAAFDRRHIFGLGCTSIVAQNEKGDIFHGRNLDYDMTGLLKNITVHVDFMKNGSILYSGVTFALYNGILTGQRPGAYSVSLNARYSGAYIDNILMEIYTKFKRPVSFFIRDVLEHQKSYAAAVETLSNTHLFSPSYIIVAGTKKNEGVVISRNRWSAANVYQLNMDANQWFLVETNFDNWKKQGDNRRITAIQKLKKIGKINFDEKSMAEVLSTSPVKNNLTVFSSVIQPENPEIFESFTWIWV
ncbi:hypothetical protein L5515_003190 [Caenorhabditis briggsae]|uniref:N-acylethanolamine-hydrolyzing acid amidase n=1 Tax=Caenorhabditis briggsae TaxID=6238 RepID=A0AAE9EIJ2_CAEBR|nr:hypothetical protein L5515_003190 [Caenorhabditis briggsae]